MSLSIISYFYFNPVKLSSDMEQMYESYGVEAVIKFAFNSEVFFYQAWAIFVIAALLSFYPLLVLMKINPVSAMRA